MCGCIAIVVCTGIVLVLFGAVPIALLVVGMFSTIASYIVQCIIALLFNTASYYS